MAWSPCPLKRFPGARQPDHRLPACSHRFQAITPRVTRVRFTPTTARNTRHVHRTHHFYRLAAALHRYLPILQKFPLFLSFPFPSRFSFLALTFLQTIHALTQPFAPRSLPLSLLLITNNHRTNPREFLFPSQGSRVPFSSFPRDLHLFFSPFLCSFSSPTFASSSSFLFFSPRCVPLSSFPLPPPLLPPPSFPFPSPSSERHFSPSRHNHQFTLAPIFYLTLAATS